MATKFEEIVTHLQTTGFVFQGSQIYGGLQNSWDYGPLGVELKNNIKNFWWRKFVKESPTNVGLDAAIIMNPGVWKATGHVATFNDPLIDCKECHARHRADNLIEEQYPEVDVHNMTNEDMVSFIKEKQVKYLERLAKNIAREVKETKEEVALENMNSYERRVIHNILTDNKYVYTESIGEEPNRHVVIKPKGE